MGFNAIITMPRAKTSSPMPNPGRAAQILQQAMDAHRTGRLADAERFYAAALEAEPRNADALHLFGALRLQQGQTAEAVRLIGAAAGERPRDIAILGNHAAALSSAGRFEEALKRYEQILAVQPRTLQGLHGRALMLMQLNRAAEAVDAFDLAISVNANEARLWFDRGNALTASGRFADAVESYDRALKGAPSQPDIFVNRGYALFSLGSHDSAIESFDRALQLDPTSINALSNRGNALKAAGRFDEALKSYERVLAIAPDHADTLNNCGSLLFERDRPADALAYFDRALSLRPGDIDFINHRGVALMHLDRNEEALANAENSLRAFPNNFDAHFYYLWNGRLAEGFRLYEHRWDSGKHGSLRPYRIPAWNGEPVGTLLVWSEQGLGDQILFASMLGELAQRVGKIVLEVEPRLVDLFARSFQGVDVRPIGPELYSGPADAQICLTSLGQFFRPDFASFPERPNGFLIANPDRVSGLRARLSTGGRPVIGVSWHSRKAQWAQYKSAELAQFSALFEKIDARWIDLQYGDTSAERVEFATAGGVTLEHLPDIDNTGDIDGLAALISACDAVVTVSNTTAHISGSVGCPTWVLAPFGHSRMWYWHAGKPDNPWYPSVRVRPQRMGQSFAALAAEVANEVSDYFGEKERTS